MIGFCPASVVSFFLLFPSLFSPLTDWDTVCKQLSYLKPKRAPDMDLLGKLGSRNELEW